MKSDLNGDKRRFTLKVSEGMAALQQKLTTIYDAGELTLKYEDEEKDLVTLKSDEDLSEALKVMNGPMRITVRATAPAAAAAEEKANFQPNVPVVMEELIRNGLDQFKLMKQQFKQASREAKEECKAWRPGHEASRGPHPGHYGHGPHHGHAHGPHPGHWHGPHPGHGPPPGHGHGPPHAHGHGPPHGHGHGAPHGHGHGPHDGFVPHGHEQPHAANKEPAGLGAALGKQGNPVKQMARFVQHVTLPEGEKIPAGQSCTKIWRVRNDSVHTWPLGSTLILVSGKNADNIATAESFPVTAALAPGEETELSVEVLAPSKPGFYQAFWRLQGPRGRKFGQRLGCSMLVTDKDGAVISSSESDGEDSGERKANKEKKQLLKQARKQAGDAADPALDEGKKAQLRAMGYIHEELLTKCLRKCDGDVEAAAARLSKKREKLNKKVSQMAEKLAALSTCPVQQAAALPAVAAAVPAPTPIPALVASELEDSEFEVVTAASAPHA